MRKAVFLDRDGVINACPGEGKFVLSWEDFAFMPGVAPQLRRLRDAGFVLVLITNQSGVGRGLMTLAELNRIHAAMQAELGADAFDAIYYCAHGPDEGCTCRKPSPEMILRACAEHGIDVRESFMVGDTGRDIEMGQAAGVRTIFCRATPPREEDRRRNLRPDATVPILANAVDWILSESVSV